MAGKRSEQGGFALATPGLEKIRLMEMSRYRRDQLRRRLTTGMRLLLPADPGPAAMLDAVRAFNPAAKRILPRRIQVDGRSQFYLSRPYPVDAGLRRQAGLPDDIAVVYFLKWVADSGAEAARYREQGTRLLDMLAARFDGTSGGGQAVQADQTVHAEQDDPVQPPADQGSAGPAGRRLTGRAGMARIALLFLCTMVFFGFAAANGTAAAWALLAVNALMGLFFAAATVLLFRRHLDRR
jgi:hypothetical protein